MKWIELSERTPPISNKYYHWRGKRCGGYSSYHEDTGFDFPESEASNHISDQYIEWLNEEIEEDNTELFQQAINHFGDSSQMLKTVEEMDKLTQAILKFHLAPIWGKQNIHIHRNLLEEMVDVEIMLSQLKLIFGSDTEKEIYEEFKKEKLNKLKVKIHKK